MKTGVRIKICGMKFSENIRQVLGFGPDYLGFIFYPGSKRYAGHIKPDILHAIPEKICKVGVFVNEDQGIIKSTVRQFGLDMIQLHGHESRDYCLELHREGYKIIKVFGISSRKDFTGCGQYENVCEFFLFDTQSKDYGGTGKRFNWNLLQYYRSQKAYFLSGGIGPDDYVGIRNISDRRLHAVDINSQFEIEPAFKDVNKIRLFIRQLRD